MASHVRLQWCWGPSRSSCDGYLECLPSGRQVEGTALLARHAARCAAQSADCLPHRSALDFQVFRYDVVQVGGALATRDVEKVDGQFFNCGHCATLVASAGLIICDCVNN